MLLNLRKNQNNQNMKWIKLAELGSRVICSSFNLKNNLLLTAKAGKLLGALPVCWLNYLNIAQTSLCTSCQQQFAAHSLSFFHLFIFLNFVYFLSKLQCKSSGPVCDNTYRALVPICTYTRHAPTDTTEKILLHLNVTYTQKKPLTYNEHT